MRPFKLDGDSKAKSSIVQFYTTHRHIACHYNYILGHHHAMLNPVIVLPPLHFILFPAIF